MMNKKLPSQEEIGSAMTWGIWEKEPSEFPWFYEQKETCYILEGSATVRDKNGNELSFTKGDWVEFEKGLECVWTISQEIKKRYRFGG